MPIEHLYTEAESYRHIIKCVKCKLVKPYDCFTVMPNGDKARCCKDCRSPQDIAESYNYLTARREEDPCFRCGGKLVYWYKTNGTLCDVFRYAQMGYRLTYIKRFLAQLTPKCEKCASKPAFTRKQQLESQAGGWKGKALRATDDETRAKCWKQHYRCVANANKLSENEEDHPEWSPDSYGGLED